MYAIHINLVTSLYTKCYRFNTAGKFGNWLQLSWRESSVIMVMCISHSQHGLRDYCVPVSVLLTSTALLAPFSASSASPLLLMAIIQGYKGQCFTC